MCTFLEPRHSADQRDPVPHTVVQLDRVPYTITNANEGLGLKESDTLTMRLHACNSHNAHHKGFTCTLMTRRLPCLAVLE